MGGDFRFFTRKIPVQFICFNWEDDLLCWQTFNKHNQSTTIFCSAFMWEVMNNTYPCATTAISQYLSFNCDRNH